ncbi:MAG: hypothetical protein RLZZ440_870 [Planctomycetota bacterium]
MFSGVLWDGLLNWGEEIAAVPTWFCRWSWIWTACIAGLLVGQAGAVEEQAAYEKVIAGRADKILATLAIDADATREAVRTALLDFSRIVNAWHEANGAKRKALGREAGEAAKESLATLEAELAGIRAAFTDRLAGVLPAADVAKVKDGLTYGVVQVTDRAYHELLPELTAEQRERIHAWLVEARDLAISEGSSEAKHGVFGKYKGRINNYLSQAGYDLKQAERDLAARRKAASSEKVSK